MSLLPFDPFFQHQQESVLWSILVFVVNFTLRMKVKTNVNRPRWMTETLAVTYIRVREKKRGIFSTNIIIYLDICFHAFTILSSCAMTECVLVLQSNFNIMIRDKRKGKNNELNFSIVLHDFTSSVKSRIWFCVPLVASKRRKYVFNMC